MFSVTSVLTVSPPSPSAVPRTIWPAAGRLDHDGVGAARRARAKEFDPAQPVFIQPRSFAGGEGTAKMCG